jgi:predicted phage terminase large subunit-like protein
MVSLGAGGALTGRGAELILADDLIRNWADSQSETLRKSLREWFLSTLLTRLEPDGTCIITQTRWNNEDLTGYLLREHGDQWREIRFPALAEVNDPLGRDVGEALCPQRYSVEDLLKKKDQMGYAMFEALYQQNPSAPQSGIFDRNWWKFYKEIEKPEFLSLIQSWDCGYQKTEGAAFSVCITIGVASNGFYIIDVYRDRLDFPSLVKSVKLQYKKFNPQLILIEAGGSGISLAQTLFSETRLPIKAVKTNNQSKESRAWEISGMVEAGRVMLPQKAPWLVLFTEELSLFPNSKYKDQTDSLSQALFFLRNHRPWIDRSRKRPSSGREPLYGSNYKRSGSGFSFKPKIRVSSEWL